MLHQAFDSYLGIIDHGEAGIDNLVKVMRRYIGRHTYGNAG